jgi:phage gpG-like protein
MSPPFVMQIELSPEALGFIGNLKDFPDKIMVALKRGLDRALPLVASRVQEFRLTGQGPFPIEEHRLGVVSGQLRQSVRFTEAVIAGSTVTASIGSPVRYAAVHEFGFDGIVNVRPFFRKFRGRDQFAKVERVSKKTGRSYRTTIKSATGVSGVREHTRHMKIPARAPFGYGVADSDQLITNAITSELETAWRSL